MRKITLKMEMVVFKRLLTERINKKTLIKIL